MASKVKPSGAEPISVKVAPDVSSTRSTNVPTRLPEMLASSATLTVPGVIAGVSLVPMMVTVAVCGVMPPWLSTTS